MEENEKLANPVWFALQETHQKFATDYNGVRFYDSDICPFGAFEMLEQTPTAMETYAKTTTDFFVVGTKQPLHNTSTLFDKAITCEQMLLETLNPINYTYEIVKLTDTYIDEIYDLVWLVMPGYYKKRTFEMGDYYGIFIENKLVAVTGERIQLDNFIEVSAVVTHPDHTRKGLAQQLVAYTTEKILEKGKTPILHVAENNSGAIKLYEKVGFKSIRKMTWHHYISN